MQNMIGIPREAFDINGVNGIDSLADIRDVKIDTSLPVAERMKSYIRQIKNPYLYKCGDTVVRVSFADTTATLEDRIKQYLLTSRTL